jgi:hypothetical protein
MNLVYDFIIRLNTVILHDMSAKKFRWSKDYESAEEELIELFERKNIDAQRFHVEPHQPIELKNDSNKFQLWCAEGSFIIDIDSRSYSMQPGDAMDIIDTKEISATSGMTGCAYYINKI